ncbi:neutral zinc metallopeptidase [Nonomuraea sp. NPDC050153]|uniref:neutral zinc metallopeptidase n=1 Tax=Nonomuraea sp. NPDC050153 TaxID=3364359 RepID=UPI0037AE39F7
MRISLLAGMVAGLLFFSGLLSGPAWAASRIAQAGLLGAMGGDVVAQTCEIPEIRMGSAASLKAFHRAMAGCADRFWAGRFAAAGLPYTPPEVTITTGSDSVCGEITSNGAQYCPEQRTIAIRIMKHDLRDPFRMNIAHSVAHEWGHHVQQLIGVLDAQNALYQQASDGAQTLLSHRLEMQAECFAGVFYSAALESIKPGIEWEDWIDAVRRADESKIHGKPRNLAFWQERGYRGGATGFCNTWTATRSKVG